MQTGGFPPTYPVIVSGLFQDCKIIVPVVAGRGLSGQIRMPLRMATNSAALHTLINRIEFRRVERAG